MRSLRRLTQAQSSSVKDAIKDTIQFIKKTFLVNGDLITNSLSTSEPSAVENSLRNLYRKEDIYRMEVIRLEKELR